MGKILVGIVIVNFNGEKFQNECIDSILKSDFQDFKIIIVDNASTDRSVELLKIFNDERIILAKQNENFGVAKGNNIGIKVAIEIGCTHTLLLNNDTIVETDFLSKLLKCNEDVTASKIFFYNKSLLWYSGGAFSYLKGLSYHLNYEKEDNSSIKSGYFEYAPTCCLLIKNSVFNKVGFMDEKYFLYLDDTDFCYRLKQNGYKIWLCVDSIIYHKVSLSTGGSGSPISTYYGNRNRLYFINKFKFGFMTKLFYYSTRYIKIIKSKIKGTDEGYYIKLAMKDYKKGNMFRKDNLIRTKK